MCRHSVKMGDYVNSSCNYTITITTVVLYKGEITQILSHCLNTYSPNCIYIYTQHLTSQSCSGICACVDTSESSCDLL